jgi:WXG100 family type VII secretion target
MTEPMSVNPEHLITSGAQADEHSQNVFITHTSADQAIESSLFSWAGQSQAAMTAKAEDWTTVTTALSTRLYAHAEALRTSGLSFAHMDQQNAENLDAVYKPNGEA